MDENPFTQNTYEWHSFEMQRASPDSYGLIWINEECFWNKGEKKPKTFQKKLAHLYAIMYILGGRATYVYVEDTKNYYRNKLSNLNT